MLSRVFAELTGTGGGVVTEVLAWAGEIIVNCGLVASPFFNLTVKSIYLFYRLARYLCHKTYF